MATIVAAVGWLLGIHLGPAAPPVPPLSAAALLAGLGLLGLVWRRAPPARLGAVAVAFGLLGVLRGAPAEPDVGPGSIAAWADRGRVEVRGRIEGEPLRLDRSMRLRVAVEEVVAPGGGGRASGALVALVPAGEWRHGDRVALVGRVERPVDGDAVPERELLARQGVWATMRTGTARVVASGPLSAPRLLDEVKALAGDALDRRLPAPHGALARGLLLGGTGGMPPDLVEAFRRSGLTHVVAVSGYNIGLVAAALLPLAAARGRGAGLVVPAVGVALFTLLAGAPASAVRAAAMGCLALLARHAGRPADPMAALAVAVLLMTAVDPGLLGDLGFQLSGLATLGLVVLFPWLDAGLRGRLGLGGDARPTTLRASVARGGCELLAATAAVELMTLPIVALAFGRVTPLSPVANLLALPAVPLAMLTSGLVVAAGPLPDGLAAPLAWLAWVPLAWIVGVAELCGGAAWASLPLGRLPAALGVGYYGLALLLLLSLHATSFRSAAPSPARVVAGLLDRVPAPLLVGSALLAAVAAWVGALQAGPSGPRLTLFEGSGAALIRTAGGRAVLVDPGPSPNAARSDLGRALPFWVDDLDVVLLTADRPDTAEALPELLRRHRVGQIAAPPGGGRWREAALARGATIVTAADATVVELGDGAALELIVRSDRAAAGLLRRGSTRVLLVGALDQAAQGDLAEVLDGGGVDLLWLGQAAALAPLLRERADPGLVVQHVRPGGRPAGGPPEGGLTVLRSDDRGTVEVDIGVGGLDVRSRR